MSYHDEKFYAYDAGLPCKNPNCKSHGRPHPNCHCYNAMGGDYAKGGEVKSFCSTAQKHQQGCQYYDDGGSVEQQPPPINPGMTLGHAAVHHGFSGLLKKAGRGSMNDPDKHHKTIHEAKNHIGSGQHDKALSMLHDHPISGSTKKSHMKSIMQHLGNSIHSQESHPNALRGSMEYLNHAIEGHSSLDSEAKRLFDKKKKSDRIKVSPESRESLKRFIDEARENPESILEAGGEMGHYLPDHAVQIGALAARGVEYLEAIRPKAIKPGPLDEEIPPEKMDVERWNRHLDIAEKPAIVLQHIADGTLEQQDVTTLKTLYPDLMNSLKDKIGEQLINAASVDKKIPYKTRQAISLVLDSPIDSTMTPQAMQAIMKANAGAKQASQTGKQQQAQNHPTSAELKTISKMDSLYETPLESRLINRKE